jgi:hypothetical protein
MHQGTMSQPVKRGVRDIFAPALGRSVDPQRSRQDTGQHVTPEQQRRLFCQPPGCRIPC